MPTRPQVDSRRLRRTRRRARAAAVVARAPLFGLRQRRYVFVLGVSYLHLLVLAAGVRGVVGQRLGARLLVLGLEQDKFCETPGPYNIMQTTAGLSGSDSLLVDSSSLA